MTAAAGVKDMAQMRALRPSLQSVWVAAMACKSPKCKKPRVLTPLVEELTADEKTYPFPGCIDWTCRMWICIVVSFREPREPNNAVVQEISWAFGHIDAERPTRYQTGTNNNRNLGDLWFALRRVARSHGRVAMHDLETTKKFLEG